MIKGHKLVSNFNVVVSNAPRFVINISLKNSAYFTGIDREGLVHGYGPWYQDLVAVLSVRSSNNPQTAVEPFENPPEGVPAQQVPTTRARNTRATTSGNKWQKTACK